MRPEQVLKPRLALVAAKVPACRTVYDIGSDHAYVPIHLVSGGICEYAYATDVKDGPLTVSKRNIEASGMGMRIFATKGDGFGPVPVDEPDCCVVISGLGGLLIGRMMIDGLVKARNARDVILQPMNYHGYLRKTLFTAGFRIEDEELVRENDSIYLVITVSSGLMDSKPTINDLYIGKSLLRKKDPLLHEFLKKETVIIEKVISGYGSSCRTKGDTTLKHGSYRGLDVLTLKYVRNAMMVIINETTG